MLADFLFLSVLLYRQKYQKRPLMCRLWATHPLRFFHSVDTSRGGSFYTQRLSHISVIQPVANHHTLSSALRRLLCPYWVLFKLRRTNEAFTLSVSASLQPLHSTVAPDNCGLLLAAPIEHRFGQCCVEFQKFQLVLNPKRVKPPTAKGRIRRLRRPPLLSGSAFAFFRGGSKEGRLRRVETLPMFRHKNTYKIKAHRSVPSSCEILRKIPK